MFTVVSFLLTISLKAFYLASFFSLVIFILICLVWIFLLTFYCEIQVGEPPIKGLYLAYKYNYLRRSSTLYFKQLLKRYPNYKLVKICYCGPKSSHVEYANGIVVSEVGLNPDVYMLEHLLKNGLSIFKTPAISHAVSICYPTVPWLPVTRWLAVAIAYPKMFSYVKENNLCAYPVMELYNKSSVSLMIPLLRQDEFVVKEAERLVNGRKYSAMLSPLPVSSLYIPDAKKIKAASSARVTKGERKG